MTTNSLDLNQIRNTLIRQEETIIFALIERAQYKVNPLSYCRDSPNSLDGGKSSFLDFMLLETEKLHARVRRYTAVDEHAFFPDQLPLPEQAVSASSLAIRPSTTNVNDKIKSLYIQKVIPQLCAEGSDQQHGSAVIADINVLQALSKRIHFGIFVAESKFMSETPEYTRLIEAADADSILALLTKPQVEAHLLKRVHKKASTYGMDIDTVEIPEEKQQLKVDPDLIVSIYRDFIIPLTKDVEVIYLMQRLHGCSIALPSADNISNMPMIKSWFQHRTACPESAVMISHPGGGGVEDVFEAVLSNRVAFGVVPFENNQGEMHATTRNLLTRESAVKVYGQISECQDKEKDTTSQGRLLVIARTICDNVPTGKDISMAVFGVLNTAGSLAAALTAFTENSVNISFIQSFVHELGNPSCFFVEFQGHQKDDKVGATLAQLQQCTSFVNMLGSFPDVGPNGA